MVESEVVESEVVESEVVESEVVESEVVESEVVESKTENDQPDETEQQHIEPAADEPRQEAEFQNQTDSIDHLLPPRFEVLDPARMHLNTGKHEFKVLLPDGKGGTQQVDQRVMRVEHEGEQVALVAMSQKEKQRRRLIQNIIAVVIGIIIMAIAFSILR